MFRYLSVIFLFWSIQAVADNDFYLDSALMQEQRFLSEYEQWQQAYQRYKEYITSMKYLRGSNQTEQEFYRLEGVRYEAELFLASSYRLKAYYDDLNTITQQIARPQPMSSENLSKWRHWHNSSLKLLRCIPEVIKNNNKDYAVVLILMNRIAQSINSETINRYEKLKVASYVFRIKRELKNQKSYLENWSSDIRKQIKL